MQGEGRNVPPFLEWMGFVNEKVIWKNKLFVALMAIIACLLWGSAFPVLKITYRELNLAGGDSATRLILAGMRFLLAAILLFSVLKCMLRLPVGVEKRWWKPLFILGLAQTGLQYFFFYNGLAFTGGIKSAVLNAVGNFLVVIVAHFVYADDRLNGGKVIGLITGFAGIILVNWQGGFEGGFWDLSLRGEGFILLSGIAGVYGTFQAKSLARDLHPVVINAYQLLFGSILLLVAGASTGAKGSFAGILANGTPLFWLLLFYSAFLSAAAFSIWYTLLQYNKAGEVTLYRFVIPISGSVLSALLLPGEDFTAAILFALVLVAAGLFVVNYWRKEEVAHGRL